MEEFCDENHGLVFRLEDAKHLDITSEAQSYLIGREIRRETALIKKTLLLDSGQRKNILSSLP